MRKLSLILLALCVLAGAVSSARAQRPTEYQVKAAFLYNFARFVEWPPRAFDSADAPVVIDVLGQDSFGPTLDRTVRDKTVRGRRLNIQRFHRLEEGLTRCHILFISRSEKDRLEEIWRFLGSSSVLTVGESDRFANAGGMVNFILQQHRVRFEINADAAVRAGLKVSSRLLKQARIVEDSQRTEKD